MGFIFDLVDLTLQLKFVNLAKRTIAISKQNKERRKMVMHIIESQQFSRKWLENQLFPLARRTEKIIPNGVNILKKAEMFTLFFEPSTRTRFSFERAMHLLGGVVTSTENAQEFSSVAKGESLEDMIRVLCGYHPAVIILRSNKEGDAKKAAEVSTIPIINAGDGTGQHPTQALLDLYTIQKELGRIDGISIAMVGDLANGRTVRSLCYLLGKFNNIKIYFVSPRSNQMKDDIKDYLKRHNVQFKETNDLRKVAPHVDVIYPTRVQKERGSQAENFDEREGFFVVNQEILDLMKPDAIIMHPLPRNNEIAPEVDKDKRAAYFRQSDNGLPIRMALLLIVLDKVKEFEALEKSSTFYFRWKIPLFC